MASQRTHERETQQRLYRKAVDDAARFCAHLLERVASPELEGRMIDVAIEDMRALSDDDRATLARAFDSRMEATITTSYRLSDEQRRALSDSLQSCLGRLPKLEFRQDGKLIAGLRIDLGAMILEGSIANELRWFAETEIHEPV